MNILLLMPRALYILIRFAEACQKHGFDLTIMMSPNPPLKRYLTTFENDTFKNVVEIPTSTDDPDGVAPFLQCFDAVIPSGEFSVIFAEKLAHKLGLFHNPLDRVQAYRNKFIMRQLFSEYGVDQPKILAKFDTMADVEQFDWSSVQFPVIAKPIDLSASLYVRLCNDVLSAKALFQRIFKHTSSFSGVSFAAQGLLEEAIFGQEYSAECVIQDGNIIFLFVTTKFLSPYPACDEIAHLCGEPLDGEIKEKLVITVQRIVQAWGLGSAVLHIEYKIYDRDVKVIEGACRIGGDMISELVELKYGISMEECLVLVRSQQDIRAVFAEISGTQNDYFYGIKYLFSETIASSTPSDIEILRKRKSVQTDAKHRFGIGFGVEKRLGHMLVRSRSLSSLKSYLAELCDAGGSIK